MGGNSVNQNMELNLVKNLTFLMSAVKNQAAVWSDFYLKTSFSKPFMVLIEPTLRCPMHCKFCNLPSDTTYPREMELSLAQWKYILDELRSFSGLIRDIFISGGEPFLRSDMCDIIEYAHHLGFGTRLVTVGAFCDEKICNRLLQSPMKWVKFSIHSPKQSVHDSLVGGAVFEKTLNAIRYLRAHQYRGKIGILTTVWEGNIRELGNIARLANQLRVDSLFYRPLFGNTAAVRHFGDPIPVHPDCKIRDLDMARSAIDELKDLKHQGYPIANTEKQLELIFEQVKGINQGIPGCHMMYESIYIRPNGDVEICGHMSLGTMGNVINDGLKSVLNAPHTYQMRHSISRFCQCQGNAFLRKSIKEKVSIVQAMLFDR